MSEPLSKEECLTTFDTIVQKYGAGALCRKWLQANGYGYEERRIQTLGLTFKEVADELDIGDEFSSAQAIRGSTTTLKWTPTEIDRVAKQIIDQHGHILPQAWLFANGYSGFVKAVTTRAHGLNSVRNKLYSAQFTRPFSRDGQVWDPWAEAGLANSLWARGIDVTGGSRYPEAYKEFSGKAYGKYDVEFIATQPPFQGMLIHVEVWGNLYGKQAEKYAVTRKLKELFHKDDMSFLGLPFNIMYNETKLETTFKKYIGTRPPPPYFHLTAST